MQDRAVNKRRHQLVWSLTGLSACIFYGFLSPDRPNGEGGSNVVAADTAEHAGVDRQAEIDDAIEKNGPLFEDWPKPKVALVFFRRDGWLPRTVWLRRSGESKGRPQAQTHLD